jgi:hypothetical protein
MQAEFQKDPSKPGNLYFTHKHGQEIMSGHEKELGSFVVS